MELIRSTTEMEPSLEPRSEAIPPETGPQESISGLEPAIQRLTMEVTEATESASEKEEEQELLRLRFFRRGCTCQVTRSFSLPA